MPKTIRFQAVVKNRKGEIQADRENPYRLGSAKRAIMDWALEQESFTKDEFLEAVESMVEDGTIETVQGGKGAAKAWWNEFYGKYSVFVPQDSE